MHQEAITSEQKRIFDKLKEFPEFYLAGGTALAFQIGHRVSVDFDLFSSKEISPKLLNRVEQIFKKFEIKVIINSPDQLSVRIGKTKVDFVKYDFPLLLDLIDFKGVKLLSIKEIAAMKAYTIGRRPMFKDYVDLYFIFKEKHITLDEIRRLSEKKYHDKFNFRLFLEQLVYLKDLKTEKIKFLKKPVTKKEIEKFFQSIVSHQLLN